MGFHMGDQEIFDTKAMIEGFAWDRMTLGGPVFDLEKLSWLNGQYLRAKSDDEWLTLLKKNVFSDETLSRVIPLVKERVEKFEDFVDVTSFFFSGDLTYRLEAFPLKNKSPGELAHTLTEITTLLDTHDTWAAPSLKGCLETFMQDKGLKPKDVLMPMRIATTGKKESPPLFETMEVLGKDMVQRRLRLAAQFLRNEDPST